MIPTEQSNPFLEMKAQEFALWMHTPTTRAFFQFLDDQVGAWREIAADLVENGAFRLSDRHEDANPDVVRGKMLALRMLRGIDLERIQRFYGQEPQDDSQDDQAHAAARAGTADAPGDGVNT